MEDSTLTSDNRKALKSGVWYTITNFITKGAAFLTTPIFTRLLSKEQVGLFSNFSSWLSILIVIVSFDLFTSLSVARFDYEDDFDNYVSSNLILGSIITIFFFLIGLCFKEILLDKLSISFIELCAMFSYFLFYPAFQMYQAKCRIEYKYKSSIAFSLLSFFLSTGCSLIFVLLFEDKYFGRWLGYLIPLVLISVILYVYLIINGKKPRLKYCKYGLIISFPLIWHTLGNTALGMSDRIMITKICGAEDNALYSISYSCAFIVQVFWTSMNAAWAPWTLERMNKQEVNILKKAAIPYTCFFGFIVFSFLLIAPEVLYLMGGESYMSAVYVIPPVMVAYVFQFLYAFYIDIELFSKKQFLIAFGTIFAAILNIILNFIFIPKFGYIAAAYTTLIGYISLFFVHFIITFLMKKVKWTNWGFNLLVGFLFIGVMFLVLLLYKYAIIRYIVICLIAMIVIGIFVIFRKEILYLLKYKSLNKFKERFKNIDEKF